MIIFLDAGGNIVTASAPEPIGRNSNDAASIYIVAPFTDSATIYLTFKLPNGEQLFGGVGESGASLPDDKAGQAASFLFTASGFSVWRYKLTANVTLFAGVVQYTVVTLAGTMRATATGSFTVQRGNKLVVPENEPDNAWETLSQKVTETAEDVEDLSKAIYGEEGAEGDGGSLVDKLKLIEDAIEAIESANTTTSEALIALQESAEALGQGVSALENGKVDKFTVAGNAGDKLYRARSDGNQDTVYIGDNDGHVARYYDKNRGDAESRGFLWARMPVRAYQAAPKKYVDDADAAIKKRLDLLELAAEGNIFAFVEDDSAAYKKAVPSTAFPNAIISKLGGITFQEFYGLPRGYVSISNSNDDLTISYDAATGTFTYSGLLGSQTTITLLDASKPLALSAGSYTFSVGPSWEIWNVTVVAYKAGSVVLWVNSEEFGYGIGTVDFTLESDVDYIELRIYDIGAIGPVDGLTLTPILVWNNGADNELKRSPVTAIENHGKNLFDESAIKYATSSTQSQSTNFGVVENGYLKAKYSAYGTTVLWAPFAMHLEAGSYTVSCDVYIGSESPTLNVVMGLSQGKGSEGMYTRQRTVDSFNTWHRITNTFNNVEEGDYFFAGCGSGNASNFSKLNVLFKNIQVEKATAATDFAPYRAPVTVFEVPQSIRNLPGYGLGIDKNTNNYIDFENKTFVQMVAERDYVIGDTSGGEKLTDGKRTIYLLESPVITDISDKLTFDGAIEVEQNGAIVAVNEYKAAIPSTVTFQVKL